MQFLIGVTELPPFSPYLCPVFLVIKNPIYRLRLHQFLGTKTTEANKFLKTDANGGY